MAFVWLQNHAPARLCVVLLLVLQKTTLARKSGPGVRCRGESECMCLSCCVCWACMRWRLDLVATTRVRSSNVCIMRDDKN